MRYYRAVYKPDKEKTMFYMKWVDEINDMMFVSEKDSECMYSLGHVFYDDDWLKMQQTGELDIEENEIYEGMNVEIVFDELLSPYPSNTKGIVKFIEGGYYVDTGKQLIKLWQELLYWKIKVFGNIEIMMDKINELVRVVNVLT